MSRELHCFTLGRSRCVGRRGASRYKEQDGINFSKSYGFLTMFAHFKEFDKQTISKGTRDQVGGAACAPHVTCEWMMCVG